MEDIERLVQEAALADLQAQFADAVNRMQPDALAALFVEDGRWHVDGEDYVGTEAIAAFYASLCGKYRRIFQIVSSHRFFLEHEGDPDQARGDVYIYEAGKDGEGAVLQLAGLYEDRYRRRPEGWRIVERVYHPSIWGTDGRLKVLPFPTPS